MRTSTFISTSLGLLLAAFLLAGCDVFSADGDKSFNTAEVADLYAAVSDEVGLTGAQREAFGRALGPHDREDRTPGYLWIVADSLSDTLTDEQKAELFERTARHERPRPFRGLHGMPGGGGYYGIGGLRGGSDRHGQSPLDEVLDLTEAQQEEIAGLHESWREALRAIRDDHRSGAITDDEALRQVMALHEQRKADLDAVLTDEQREALAAFREEREAAFETFREEVVAVRDEVLGLSDEESDTMNALFSDHMDAREVLLESFQAGELTRAEWDAEVDELHAALQEALQALLTDAQYEVVLIHRALVFRIGKRGHRGRPGPPGGGGR